MFERKDIVYVLFGVCCFVVVVVYLEVGGYVICFDFVEMKVVLSVWVLVW